MKKSLHFQLIDPYKSLTDFVYCFSSLQNFSIQNQAVIIPNGKIDLIFFKTNDHQLRIALLGLETKPKYTNQEVANFYSVAFNPLAIKYIFNLSIADILNSGKILTNHFWGFAVADLNDFEKFCKKITKKTNGSVASVHIKNRKKHRVQIMPLIYKMI